VKFSGCTSQSHWPFADHDDIPEFDGSINASLDPTDVTDADVFEELRPNITIFPAVIRDQASLQELPNIPPGTEEPANHTEAGDLETISTVVIDQFPHRSAGTTIPCMARAESSQGAHADLVWAPFKSQSDWCFAYWAKINGPTSSAVTRLLKMPGVRSTYCLKCMPHPH
jgi:hypothetical protein